MDILFQDILPVNVGPRTKLALLLMESTSTSYAPVMDLAAAANASALKLKRANFLDVFAKNAR